MNNPTVTTVTKRDVSRHVRGHSSVTDVTHSLRSVTVVTVAQTNQGATT